MATEKGKVEPDEVLPVQEPVETEPTVEGVSPTPEFLTKQELEEKVAYLEGKLEQKDKHWQSIAERKAGTRREIEEAKRETGRLREEFQFLSERYLAGLPEEERMRAEFEMYKRRQEAVPQPQQPQGDPQDAALMALPDVHAKLIEEDISLDHPDLEWPTLETAPTLAKGRDVMLRSIRKIVSERKAQVTVTESVSEEKTKTKAEKKTELEEEPPPVETGGIRSPASRGVDQLRDAYGAGEISSKEYTEQMRALGKEP